jgi:biotin transport system substrate-specific component
VESTKPVILADVLFPVSSNAILRNIILAIAGSLLLWASAKVKIPFYPVPMTMTTFVVLVIGMVYGWKLGAATILLYLAEGAMGLPVFAGTPEKGIGIAYMMGPTGGYLMGYVLAAAICGYLAQLSWDKRTSTTALAMLIGNAAIYIPGLLWLGMLLGWDKPILEWGLIPFIAGDILKLALAAATIPLIWKLSKRRD